VGITTSINSSFNNSNTEYISHTNTSANNSIYAGITPAFGIGIGRIESVKDARQAIYILDDLSKRSSLTRHLSDDEIFKFSQLISKVKNKRFLDARLHKIDEISTVDSFLVDNNLLSKSDATYFTTLYDNWENGANFERNSGQIFEIILSPSANWSNRDDQYDISNPVSSIWTKQNNYNYSADLSFNYNYAKQMNLNWENNFNVSLSGASGYFEDKYSTNEGIENVRVNSYNNNSISFLGIYSIGYYPNSRTNLTAGLHQYLKQIFNNGISDNSSFNYFDSQTILRFSAVYYVSPQLSLTGDASIGDFYEQTTFSSETSNNTNRLGANFSATLKYSFF